MNILVTGGAGYIGSHTVKLLVKRHNVVVLDTLENGHFEAIDSRACFIEGDFGDKNLVERIIRQHKIDAVMHLAGYIDISESVSDPYKYYHNNIYNSLQLFKAMHNSNVKRIVFSSSAAVYGCRPENKPISEDSPLMPISPYGSSCLAVENALSNLGFDFVSLRYFNVAGAAFGLGEDHQPETHLIPLLIKKALSTQDAVLFGSDYPTHDGTCIRDYVHVEDIANANLLALSRGRGVYNVGCGIGFSNKQILQMVSDGVGKLRCLYDMRRPGDAPSLVADIKKIRKLGWKPKHTIKSIIKSAAEWQRSHPGGYE
ncbi:MAG: UDP-glucose 4-epimerase GalE [Candidatus Woesearchaeota archaeon]